MQFHLFDYTSWYRFHTCYVVYSSVVCEPLFRMIKITFIRIQIKQTQDNTRENRKKKYPIHYYSRKTWRVNFHGSNITTISYWSESTLHAPNSYYARANDENHVCSVIRLKRFYARLFFRFLLAAFRVQYFNGIDGKSDALQKTFPCGFSRHRIIATQNVKIIIYRVDGVFHNI